MALTERSYQLLTVELEDRDLNRSSVELRFSALLDITDFLTAIPAAVIPAIQGVSDAVVVGWSFSRQAVDPVPALAPESAEVQRKGVFSMQTDNGFTTHCSVPSIRNSLVIDRTNKINLADAAVVAFTNILTGVTLIGTAQVVSNRDENVVRVLDAEKRHKADSKG